MTFLLSNEFLAKTMIGNTMNQISSENILGWINEELQKLTGDENLKVTESTKLLDIPHLDSIIFVSFVLAFEKKYNAKIPMEEVVKNITISFFISCCS